MFKNFLENNFIIKIFYKHLKFYPSPFLLNYFWSFGSLAGLCLILQILTGIFLAMHYSPQINLAFFSIEHIMRDVSSGWLLRYLHSNGASMFFAVIYLHILRGLLFKSYKYSMKNVWFSGMIIFILMMATAFIGYVLPWGQMSYWGATVITNIFSAIPFIGISLVYWLWGGFSVGNATLNKFFSLHYLLPFIIAILVVFHIAQLHKSGSSSPFPLNFRNFRENLFFYSFFVNKDIIGVIIFFIFFIYFVFFYPNYLGHSDNYIEANQSVTPLHIVPEWYFLPFYAILRSIPNKLGGIVMMFFSIAIFLILPFLGNIKNELLVFLNIQKKLIVKDYTKIFFSITLKYYKIILICFLICFITLGWIGAKPAENPYIELGLFLTFLFIILVIFLTILI